MVTIPTRDHGDVVVSCPAWCTQQYHQAGGYRVDITHTSPDTELTVPTAEGPAVLLRAVFTLRPFSQPAGVYVAVEVDGEWHPCDPAQLDEIARGLTESATRLRSIARRLAVLKETGR